MSTKAINIAHISADGARFLRIAGCQLAHRPFDKRQDAEAEQAAWKKTVSEYEEAVVATRTHSALLRTLSFRAFG
jgi:hypothetical protein